MIKRFTQRIWTGRKVEWIINIIEIIKQSLINPEINTRSSCLKIADEINKEYI